MTLRTLAFGLTYLANPLIFLRRTTLVWHCLKTVPCNTISIRMTQAVLLSARLIVSHLVVEVTGFSQTVNGEKTLPHSTSQAWRNTHPDKSLNLKTQRECVGKQYVRLQLLHGRNRRVD